MDRKARGANRRCLRAVPVLLVLLTALVLEGFPVIHAHVDGEPGFYNTACSLSLLAASTGGAPLPSKDLPGSRLPELPAPIETAESSPPSPPIQGFASRAPPVV